MAGQGWCTAFLDRSLGLGGLPDLMVVVLWRRLSEGVIFFDAGVPFGCADGKTFGGFFFSQALIVYRCLLGYECDDRCILSFLFLSW